LLFRIRHLGNMHHVVPAHVPHLLEKCLHFLHEANSESFLHFENVSSVPTHGSSNQSQFVMGFIRRAIIIISKTLLAVVQRLLRRVSFLSKQLHLIVHGSVVLAADVLKVRRMKILPQLIHCTCSSSEPINCGNGDIWYSSN
jgi:hypothetical protein